MYKGMEDQPLGHKICAKDQSYVNMCIYKGPILWGHIASTNAWDKDMYKDMGIQCINNKLYDYLN